jgi:hypothetical protein
VKLTSSIYISVQMGGIMNNNLDEWKLAYLTVYYCRQQTSQEVKLIMNENLHTPDSFIIAVNKLQRSRNLSSIYFCPRNGCSCLLNKLLKSKKHIMNNSWIVNILHIPWQFYYCHQ